MPRDAHSDELNNERAAEQRYAAAMEQRAQRRLPTQGPRSTFWTGSGQPKARQAAFGELVGRVALDGPDQGHLQGRSDFYIGDRHFNLDGVEVFSWAAKVACTLFRGTAHHELCEKVAVIRTFAHHGGRISDFYDEPLIDDPPPEPFTRRILEVPAAPTRPQLPNRSAADPRASAAAPTTAPTQVLRAASRGAPPPIPPVPIPPSDQPAAGRLRAPELLQAQLAAPRKERLAVVLSTLQADQYEIVSAPGRTNLIVEGQPGTGKTVIAAHRAAFLVSPAIDVSDWPSGRVLLVGPSREYSEHVAGLISTLASGSAALQVIELPRIMELITGQTEEKLKGPATRSWQDVDHELAELAVLAINQIKASGTRRYADLRKAVAHVYELLRSNGDARPLTDDGEWRRYLRRLPPIDRAWAERALQPLLAYIAGRLRPHPELRKVGHIIVDEAQDVHPLEWDVLYEINTASNWTIFGDLNQRRSDHTEPSWQPVADRLNILVDGSAPVTRLLRGYRSTRPIIQFANRLLPRAERELESLQREGPVPLVVRAKELAAEVAAQATTLLERYPEGTVAIIDVAPEAVCARLREQGWVAERRNPRRWRRGSLALTVIPPDRARGLEFDGVVVVEPAAFSPNFGRQGQLYTALTRPNRELVVVHQRPLPEELRVRRR